MHYLLGHPTSQIKEYLINSSLRGISKMHSHLVKKAGAITPDILLQVYEYMDMKKPRDTVFWCPFLFVFLAHLIRMLIV